jgi:hypothetical protein
MLKWLIILGISANVYAVDMNGKWICEDTLSGKNIQTIEINDENITFSVNGKNINQLMKLFGKSLYVKDLNSTSKEVQFKHSKSSKNVEMDLILEKKSKEYLILKDLKVNKNFKCTKTK